MPPLSRSWKNPTTKPLAVAICFLLLLSTLVIGIPKSFSATAKEQVQEQVRGQRPVSGPPADDLPNLDEIRRRPQEQRQARLPIPSSIRARKKPMAARNGLKVG